MGPSDDVPPLCLSRNDIADCYIQEYRRLSGEAIARADFLAEVDAVWMAWNTRRLPRVIKPALDGDAKARGTLEFLLDSVLSWTRGEPFQ